MEARTRVSRPRASQCLVWHKGTVPLHSRQWCECRGL